MQSRTDSTHHGQALLLKQLPNTSLNPKKLSEDTSKRPRAANDQQTTTKDGKITSSMKTKPTPKQISPVRQQKSVTSSSKSTTLRRMKPSSKCTPTRQAVSPRNQVKETSTNIQSALHFHNLWCRQVIPTSSMVSAPTASRAHT